MSETVKLQFATYILNRIKSSSTCAVKFPDGFQLRGPMYKNRIILLNLKLAEGSSARLGSVCQLNKILAKL